MALISFEDWMANESGDLLPELSFLAMAGDQVAAVVLCKVHMGNGKVLWLGVRPAFRRLGLGMALLHQAFGEFYRRGLARVELRVDAENVTGATRVYERAGMRVTHRFDICGKELRAGR
jgi:ribosomal protein S18 acetylase RimI-like enzyme